MNRWYRISSALLFVMLLCFSPFGQISSASAEKKSMKALVVTGQTNPWHNWKISSPILIQYLEQTGLFKVDVARVAPETRSIENFKPDFAGYDVVVLDYDGHDRAEWSEQTKAAFVEYVRSGGGVVVYHSANNAFPKWVEFNEIIGLGGWGGRDEKCGPMVRFREGKVVLDNSPGKAGSHPMKHEFQIVIRDREHPIMKGLPERWMHAKGELYGELRGPAKNLTVLATGYSNPSLNNGTGEHEPVLFTINYGQGRVFHTVLGHAREMPVPSMECVGFIVTFQRGVEWAATGEVTQKVPDDFPSATEVRVRKDCKRLFLDELLEKIATFKFGQSRKNLSIVADIVRESYKSKQQRKYVEKRFLEFLRSDATLAAKQFVCQQLSVIGTEESVPSLAAMLADSVTSDMARYALERIPGGAVDKAMREALPKASGKVRVGIINTLGERGDVKAVDMLGKLIADSNPVVGGAAIWALGKIGGDKAAAILGEAKSKVSAQLRLALADAYLMCADKLLAEGRNNKAIAIYERMYSEDEPSQIRIAALGGLVAAGSKKSVPFVIEQLGSKDAVMQTMVMQFVRELPGEARTKAFARQLPKLSSRGQVLLLSALADRGDKAALPAVAVAATSEEHLVRVPALKAVGRLGDASSVELLVQLAARTAGDEREAARESLYRLRGPKVDGTIVAGIAKAEPKVKVELIRSLGRRMVTTEVETLLKTARDTDSNVRLESIRVLRDVAGAKNISALVDLLISAKSDIELREAKKTVALVSHKSAGENIATAAVLEALAGVKDVKIRCSLLEVLGEIGHCKGVGVLRDALEDDSTEIQTAAIRALSEWPDAEPISDLLRVVKQSDSEIHRVLALRGFIRLVGLESERPTEETIKMYKEAMALAPGVGEKKLVLSGLANVKSFAALYMASEYLEDDALQQEAGAAMVKIAEFTHGTHPQQTRILLKMVIEVSKSDSLRQQAQKVIEQIK